jgi:CBS domain containing-hemolysin-like protein
MLRRIPRRTDVVEWEGWRFEVVDVDSHRVDQVMITARSGAAGSGGARG